jgi:hypothetical protein
MPSDQRVPQALAALAQPIAEFRTLALGALAQAESHLGALAADPDARSAGARAELGAFADGRVDAAGFAALFPNAARTDASSASALRRAVNTLRAVRDRGEELFVVKVPENGRLGATVDAALAEAGRALGAVVVSELVRGGRYRAAEHERLLDVFEFHNWNRAERRFAPPLIVALDGAALHAGDLADFADGHVKLVLVVRGACPPAPLARCITPGTLVLQSVDGVGLDRVASCDGPAIAALVPDGAAQFLHDPLGGRESWQRLAVRHLPEAPKKPIGGMSAWQMGEDLRLLGDLARTPFAVPSGAGGPAASAIGSTDAADRLAHWLLGQSGLAEGV